MDVKSWLVDADTMDRVQQLDALISEQHDDDQKHPLGVIHDHANVSFIQKQALDMCKIPTEVFEDLEIFSSYREAGESRSSSTTVYESVDRTILQGSKYYLRGLLQNPVSQYACLIKRQVALEKLKSKYVEHRQRTESMLSNLSFLERDALWIYRSMGEEMEALHEIAYFRSWFMSSLNGSSACLTGLNLYKIVGSPLIGLLSPIMYFIVPFAVLRLKFNVRIPFRTYIHIMWRSFFSPNAVLSSPAGGQNSNSWLKYVSCGFSMLFYFQSLFSSFEISATLRKICDMLVNRMHKINSFLSNVKALTHLYWEDDVMESWFSYDASSKDSESDILVPVDQDLPPHRFSLLSNFGHQLKEFRQFNHRHNAILISKAYMIDALLSILRLRESPGFCKTDVIPTKNAFPKLHVQDGWHPCIPYDNNVKNSYRMGGGAAAPGMMLTGPNAGGKSTLLKSMMISVLMAQSILTAPAKAIHLTPFSYLNSHVNVPDCKGRTSLFEAEMNRAKSNIDALRRLKEARAGGETNKLDKFAFIIMDEIFSSTNPIEGIAGGYAVAKNIAETGICISAISTHFTYLSKLAKTTKLYSNWQMPVKLSQGEQFEYPYKLKKGVCRQYIALELLKLTCFDDCIIKDALEIKRSMTESVPEPKPEPPQLAE